MIQQHHHGNEAMTIYDSVIWASWLGRGGAFHEDSTLEDPVYTRKVQVFSDEKDEFVDVDVVPCINDDDRESARRAARLVIDKHKRLPCGSAEDCQGKARAEMEAFFSAFEALNKEPKENFIADNINFMYTSEVGYSNHRSGNRHHTSIDQHRVEPILVQEVIGGNDLYPCISNTDRRRGREGANSYIQRFYPEFPGFTKEDLQP